MKRHLDMKQRKKENEKASTEAKTPQRRSHRTFPQVVVLSQSAEFVVQISV